MSVLAQLTALLIAVVFAQLGHGLFGSFLGLRADLEGFPTPLIGALGSAFYAGMILGTLRIPALVNRIGHIRAFATFSSICASVIVMHGLLIDPYAWVVLRVLFGFSYAGVMIVSESWLNNRATNETRGTVLSIYMMAVFLALGTGQLALSLADPETMVLFMVGALCFSLALVPVSITRSTHPDPVSSVHFGLKKLFEISPGAVIACIGSGLIGGAYFGMGVIYARQVGLDLAEISLFMGALMVSGLLLQWPIGRLSDHIDRRWVISGTCFNAALFALAMAWLPPSNWWLFLGVTGMFGGLAACIYPLAIAHANDFIEPHDLVPASSGMVLCYGLGAVLGPVCGAAAMELFGPGGLFLFIAINCFGVVGFTWYRSTRRTLLPTVEKDPYVLLPDVVAMPVAIDVDPRAMEHFEPEDVGPPTEEALIEAGVIDEPRPVAQNA